MRTTTAAILGWCVALAAACSGEQDEAAKPPSSPGPNASGGQPNEPGEPIPPTCAGFVRRLTACGVISGTHFARCRDDAPLVPCLVACASAASCEELTNAYCVLAQNEFASCATRCRESLMDFTCKDGSVIKATWKCDGTPDCPDGDDEDCPEGTFVCQGGQRIPLGWRCDNTDDCPGAEDERDCSGSPMFICGNGVAVSESTECDGASDCPGGEDEADCTKLICN
ncbi:MAG TPA: hypothetical protein VFQ35_17685 [Polyangiaceae bacterium]|nr:hypothetical protein [Polyangiaceae bacterium]